MDAPMPQRDDAASAEPEARTSGKGGKGGPDEDGVSTNTATFVEHLDELRTRLIRSVFYIVLGCGITCLFGYKRVMDIVLGPIQRIFAEHPDEGGIVVLGPAEFVFIFFKILLIAGLCIASPFVLMEIYGFVAPALTRNEKGYARWGFVFAPALFATGVLFGYLVVPIGLRWLFNFTMSFGVKQMIAVDKYASFFTTILLGLGIVFQMPLITAVLAKIGLLNANFLASKRRYAIVILVTVAAIITPTPDVVNLAIVTVPMLVLFEISILVAKVAGRSDEEIARIRQRKRDVPRKPKRKGRKASKKAEEPPDDDSNRGGDGGPVAPD